MRNLDCDVTSWLRHALRARQGVDGGGFAQLRMGSARLPRPRRRISCPPTLVGRCLHELAGNDAKSWSNATPKMHTFSRPLAHCRLCRSSDRRAVS